jgi:transcriptional regulator with XRE-family HTH domain
MYENFAHLMEQHGLTPYRVSKDTGISQSTLSDWKTGRSVPKREKLQLLADYFKVPLSVITEGAEAALPRVYADAEMQEYLQALQTRSEMRMLFKLAKNATKEDVETAVRIIEALQK